MDARLCEPVLADVRVLAGALDLVDAVGADEPKTAIPDLVRPAVERPDGRACHPVAFGVVLAAVAGAAEATRRQDWRVRDLPATREVGPPLLRSRGAVRLHRAP